MSQNNAIEITYDEGSRAYYVIWEPIIVGVGKTWQKALDDLRSAGHFCVDSFIDLKLKNTNKAKEEKTMSEYKYQERDFEHPSFLFKAEDLLKNLIGGPLFYQPYYRTFGLKGDERVLDFGCGGGAGSRCLLQSLNERGHLTCVDIANFWMEKATKRLSKYPNAECRIGDIRKMDLADSSFDVITVMHVIHDIPPAERQSTVKALGRKLKNGGTLFIREPLKESHGMPIEEIRALLSDAGLQEKDYKNSKSEYMGAFQKMN